MREDFIALCRKLRCGAEALALESTKRKNGALENVRAALIRRKDFITGENQRDVNSAEERGFAPALIDRLRVTEKTVEAAVRGIESIIAQPDPCGEIIEERRLYNGLRLRQIRVPLGVAAIIYEARPAVSVDAFALAYKSGNALLLRGSASARRSNKAFLAVIEEGLSRGGLPGAIALTEVPVCGHRDVDEILNARGLIDVVIPRGGKSLIKHVVDNARIPVIETGSGVCHLFVDKSARPDMAAAIAENGKLQRPSVCNALETLVVHRDILKAFLPELDRRFAGSAELRCDGESFAAFGEIYGEAGSPGLPAYIKEASDADFGFEFLDNIMAVKTVGGIDEAVEFINAHNTKHSEAIVTEDAENAALFQKKIDAACVYVNASTRFTDGGEFGLGAELGISTQKLHIRGPMGLKALTTSKYLITGEGQVR